MNKSDLIKDYISTLIITGISFGILILLGILGNHEVQWYDIFMVAFMLLSFKYLIVI